MSNPPSQPPVTLNLDLDGKEQQTLLKVFDLALEAAGDEHDPFDEDGENLETYLAAKALRARIAARLS
ncbi:hypothetical protein [Streptosporangium roseum]|uniref:hypothetical protein n=1 Tax=Streptosporangium roseum TaxID=2001 RepID=UPI00332E7BD4